MLSYFPLFPDNTKPEMGSPTGKLHYFQWFQLDLPVKTLKEPQPAAKQHRHDIDMEFIGKTRPQTLLPGICGAYDIHIAIARGSSRLTDGAFDAIRDEGKSHVIRLPGMPFGRPVCENEDRHLILVIASEPIRVFCHGKRIPTHYHRAGIPDGFSSEFGFSPGGQVGIQRIHAAIAVVDISIHRYRRP